MLTEQSLSAENRAELLAANVVGAETVTAVAFFVNDIDTKTTGLDLVADTAPDLVGGRLDVTLAWNVTDTRILERGATLSDRGVGELEDGLPESRGTLTLDYARNAWTAVLRWRYYGELYEHLFNCESCWIETGAMVAVDAELSWAVSDRLTATLGVKNVRDRQPDRHRFAGVAGYLGADYPLNHPAGFNGGSYSLRLSNAR